MHTIQGQHKHVVMVSDKTRGMGQADEGCVRRRVTTKADLRYVLAISRASVMRMSFSMMATRKLRQESTKKMSIKM